MVTETKSVATPEPAEELETTEVSEVEAPEAEEPSEAEAVEKATKPEVITFQNQAELDKHIKKQVDTMANSIANKSTANYQQQVKDLKAQLKTATSKKEDDALAHLLEQQTDEWGNTPEVGEFQTALKKLIADRRAFQDKDEQWEENHQKATQSVREVNAFTQALTLLLPEDDAGFISALTGLAEKIAGADTERERELLIELEKARLQALAEAEAQPKPKRTTPDHNLPTAPGGVDLSKLSDEERFNRAVAKMRERQK